jgi:hypothetical protein
MLRLAEGTPVTWHLATQAGDDAPLADDELSGFAVDSGTAMFASPAGARLFGKKLTVLGMVNFPYITQVSKQMEANAPNGGAWANVVLDANTGTNVVAFQSGFGDGVYATYWGYDAEGGLICLAIDFDLLYEDEATP